MYMPIIHLYCTCTQTSPTVLQGGKWTIIPSPSRPVPPVLNLAKPVCSLDEPAPLSPSEVAMINFGYESEGTHNYSIEVSIYTGYSILSPSVACIAIHT